MVGFKYIEDNSRQNQHDTCIKLLIEIMRGKYGVCANENDIAKDDLGKPFFAASEMSGYFFSISHCRGLCCCMVSDAPCGIDCEIIRSFKNGTAKRVMTEKEFSYFKALSVNEKPRAFFLLWTLKEAYGKYTGRGIADMKNISFSFENDMLVSDKPELDFYVYSEGEYFMSVCCKKGHESECFFGKRIF